MGPTHIPNNTELTDTGLTYEERWGCSCQSEADGHRELSEKEREREREPTTKGEQRGRERVHRWVHRMNEEREREREEGKV